MKTGDYIIKLQKNKQRVKSQYTCKILKFYQTMPAGIGEHSDITEAVIES